MRSLKVVLAICKSCHRISKCPIVFASVMWTKRKTGWNESKKKQWNEQKNAQRIMCDKLHIERGETTKRIVKISFYTRKKNVSICCSSRHRIHSLCCPCSSFTYTRISVALSSFQLPSFNFTVYSTKNTCTQYVFRFCVISTIQFYFQRLFVEIIRYFTHFFLSVRHYSYPIDVN